MSRCNLFFSKPALITACGNNSDSLWNRIISADNSAIKLISTKYGTKSFYSAVIEDNLSFRFDSTIADTHIIRIVDYALNELKNSIQQAVNKYGNNRIGICIGGCDNSSELSIAAHEKYLLSGSFPDDYNLSNQSAYFIAEHIKKVFGITGPSTAMATACSSSGSAIIKAAQLICSGLADAMIVGGADIVSDLELLGFDSIECISSSPTNPFSQNRSGITLGEAAVFFVLSKDKLFSDEPSIMLAGYGETADAVHITSPDVNASGAVRAMQQAIEYAGIKPEQVGYINLHGTGTQLNDAMEATAVNKVFGTEVPCSATKSITGHTLGASSALSTAICYETIVRNAGKTDLCLPAQAWDRIYDKNIPPIRIISRENSCIADKSLNYCMSNSFGFGGINVSLLIKKGD